MIFDDIPDEPNATASTSPTSTVDSPQYHPADESGANALGWMASGTINRTDPTQAGKPAYYDDLPELERKQDPKDRTIGVLANQGSLGALPYIRAGVEAMNRGESFWGGSDRYERERKAIQQYYNDAYEAASDPVKVLGGIGLPGGPMAQAGKYLTSAARPIVTAAGLGAAQAGIAGYLAPIEPGTADWRQRLLSAVETMPIGAVFGGAAGSTGHLAQYLHPKVSTPEELAAFHKQIEETQPVNPFGENARAAEAIQNRDRLIEDQSDRQEAVEPEAAPAFAKAPAEKGIFDDIPDEGIAPAGEEETPPANRPYVRGVGPEAEGRQITPQEEAFALSEGQLDEYPSPRPVSPVVRAARSALGLPTWEKVYHGTDAAEDFEKFNTPHVFFTNDKGVANEYGGVYDDAIDNPEHWIWKEGHSPRVMPAYINTKDFAFLDEKNGRGIPPESYIEEYKDRGYKGLIVKTYNDVKHGEYQYITWTPGTVKSSLSGSPLFALSGQNIRGAQQLRGTFPQGPEGERYAMQLTDAEPYLFKAAERAGGLGKVTADLESGNVTDQTRKRLNYATQDIDLLARKFNIGEQQQTRPVEAALQDASAARQQMQTAFDAGDADAFRSAAGDFRNAVNEAAQARVEVARQRLAPKAFDDWMENNVPKNALFALTAYHGTPHDFMPEEGYPAGRFRADKIGTGEGAQAFGYGHYFAESQGTAKSYQVNLGPINAPFGKNVAKTWVNQYGDDAANKLSQEISRVQRFGSDAPELRAALDHINNGTATTPDGRLYTVSLDVEPEDLLDWDKPVKDQPYAIQKALNKLDVDPKVTRQYGKFWVTRHGISVDGPHDTKTKAEDFINRLREYGSAAGAYKVLELAHGPQETSRMMANAGISGIRYFDQDSRASGEGTRNYVIFPGAEDRIKITHKDGTPVTPEERQAVLAQTAPSPMGEQPNAVAAQRIRDRVQSIVSSGKPHGIEPRTVAENHEVIKTYANETPPAIPVTTITSIKPFQYGGEPWVSLKFVAPGGRQLAFNMKRDDLFATRAAWLPGDRAITLFDFGDAIGANPKQGVDTLGGRIRHELVHGLRDTGLFTDGEWRSLVAHADALQIMDQDVRDLFRLVGVPNWENTIKGKSIREVYHEAYADRNPAELRELMDQEAVAHMVEIYHHALMKPAGNPFRQGIEQAFADAIPAMQKIFSGEIANRSPEDVTRAAQEPAFAAANPPLASRDLDTLGYYSGAIEAAKNLKQAKGTPEQMLAQLKKGGAKDAEIEATNLRTFLEGKKSVTRDDIVKYLDDNRVRLNEVVRQAAGYDENGYPIGSEGAEGQVPKWQSYSLDPDNSTYRETVLHLPTDNIAKAVPHPEYAGWFALRRPNGDYDTDVRGKVRAWQTAQDAIAEAPKLGASFMGGHFPEPNITGHLMTSMVKDAQGRSVFNIDQIQSDWGQKLRDEGVRDEAKISSILKQMADIEDEITNIKADERKKFTVLQPTEHYLEQSDPVRVKRQEQQRLKAELATAEASATGHPLVNTTSQWVNTTLRRALRLAIENGADAISIPTGDTVLSYNPGDKHGMNEFYNKIVPLALGKIMKAADPDAGKPEFADKLVTPNIGAVNRGHGEQSHWLEGIEELANSYLEQYGRKNAIERLTNEGTRYRDKDYIQAATLLRHGENGGSGVKFGFQLFPITDAVKAEVMGKGRGQPLFARGGAVKAKAKLEGFKPNPKVNQILRKYASMR